MNLNRVFVLLLLVFAMSLHAQTRNNDDSCDIAVAPAATLLLPYFEVDLDGGGETTVFTVTNTAALPQAVQVTIWTDFEYPVLAFNLFLTGYDMHSLNLYDVLAHGRIAQTGSGISNEGELSEPHSPLLNESSCAALPILIPQPMIERTKSALVLGKVPAAGNEPACNAVGGFHQNAVGYVTIDVVGACEPRMPTQPAYYRELIRYDNVLIGDYVQLNERQRYAQGAPMVHVRAIPEGGTAESRERSTAYRVNFERTFYSRFQDPAAPKLDARQPLPAVWAARWISGGKSGFDTSYKIWREGRTTPTTACSARPALAAMNFIEVVRFDEQENPETFTLTPGVCTPITVAPVVPNAARIDVENPNYFPPTTFGAVGGWTYLNLDHCPCDGYATQNWVITSMRAESRYSTDSYATPLGNGCSPQRGESSAMIAGLPPIGPLPNVHP